MKLLSRSMSKNLFLAAMALVLIQGFVAPDNVLLSMALAALGVLVGLTNISKQERGGLLLIALFLGTIGIGGAGALPAVPELYAKIATPLLRFATAMGATVVVLWFFDIAKS